VELLDAMVLRIRNMDIHIVSENLHYCPDHHQPDNVDKCCGESCSENIGSNHIDGYYSDYWRSWRGVFYVLPKGKWAMCILDVYQNIHSYLVGVCDRGSDGNVLYHQKEEHDSG
jgi:hypothetical protein